MRFVKAEEGGAAEETWKHLLHPRAHLRTYETHALEEAVGWARREAGA
jgi:hypothetical protein